MYNTYLLPIPLRLYSSLTCILLASLTPSPPPNSHTLVNSNPPSPPPRAPPPSTLQPWSNCCSVLVILCVMLTTFVYFALQCVDGVLTKLAGTPKDPREYLGVTATVQQGASVVLIVALLHAVIVLVAITCLWRRLVGVRG